MAIYIPDTDDRSLMRCADGFAGQAFTAEEFCSDLYKSSWGMGTFVAGKLRRLVNRGQLETVGKRGKKTLYRVKRAG